MKPRKTTRRRARETTEIKARPTMYCGIRMRSRLEADFAGFLDRAEAEWEYEPTCFAGPGGQWLPDFGAKMPDGPHVYFEIKPESFTRDEVDPVLEQMSVAWLTEPTAVLQLVIWRYGNPLGNLSVMGFPREDEDDDDMTWWVADGAADDNMHPWPGMGQFRAFIERAEREAQADVP